MKKSFPEFPPVTLNQRGSWPESLSLNRPNVDMYAVRTTSAIPKRILMETVPGTNRQGRPRKIREDDIMAGTTFHMVYRIAQDRNTWSEFVRGANVLRDTVQR